MFRMQAPWRHSTDYCEILRLRRNSRGFEPRNKPRRGKKDPGYFHPSVEARTRELRGCLGGESGSQDMTHDTRRMPGESTLRNQR